MVLTGTEPAADGTASLLRGIWRPEGTGVRETAERSSDGGKTWRPLFDIWFRPRGGTATARTDDAQIDRKSTRLNSSHGYISYAVFCLKKKKSSSINR